MIVFDNLKDFRKHCSEIYSSNSYTIFGPGFDNYPIRQWQLNLGLFPFRSSSVKFFCFLSAEEFESLHRLNQSTCYPHSNLESFLQSELVPGELKKLIIFNLDLFS